MDGFIRGGGGGLRISSPHLATCTFVCIEYTKCCYGICKGCRCLVDTIIVPTLVTIIIITWQCYRSERDFPIVIMLNPHNWRTRATVHAVLTTKVYKLFSLLGMPIQSLHAWLYTWQLREDNIMYKMDRSYWAIKLFYHHVACHWVHVKR